MTNSLPKILEEEDKKWRALGFKIVYIGKYPENHRVDVYRTFDVSGKNRETGFPTVYLVTHSDYVEREGLSALHTINETMEFSKKRRKVFFVLVSFIVLILCLFISSFLYFFNIK